MDNPTKHLYEYTPTQNSVKSDVMGSFSTGRLKEWKTVQLPVPKQLTNNYPENSVFVGDWK